MGLPTAVGSMQMQKGYRAVAASIPGAYLVKKNFAGASHSLQNLLQASASGILPISQDDSRADAEGSLWFIRAAHLFAAAGGDQELAIKLLENSKRMLLEFISEKGVAGITMDHGGLLMVPPTRSSAETLRLNALWYSALQSTADDLKKANDPGGDHFDRLAGRFRRTFIKSYWCEGHNRICPPHVRDSSSHGDLPDADQLLLTILPSSPIPRTKQNQLVKVIYDRANGEEGAMGILVNHPVLGIVESAIHRAWMAVGLVNSSENRTAALTDARAILRPLISLATAGQGVWEYYRNGEGVGEGPDLLTTAEVMGAVEALS